MSKKNPLIYFNEGRSKDMQNTNQPETMGDEGLEPPLKGL